MTVASSPLSRYRLVGRQADISGHNADCNDDHPGWTHLLSPDSAGETNEVRTAIATGTTFYVGVVQPRDQATEVAGWLTFGGAPLDGAFWQGSAPNDLGGIEDNDQNLAAADNSGDGLLNDLSGTTSHDAVCECDGWPIPAAVVAAFAASAP